MAKSTRVDAINKAKDELMEEFGRYLKINFNNMVQPKKSPPTLSDRLSAVVSVKLVFLLLPEEEKSKQINDFIDRIEDSEKRDKMRSLMSANRDDFKDFDFDNFSLAKYLEIDKAMASYIRDTIIAVLPTNAVGKDKLGGETLDSFIQEFDQKLSPRFRRHFIIQKAFSILENNAVRSPEGQLRDVVGLLDINAGHFKEVEPENQATWKRILGIIATVVSLGIIPAIHSKSTRQTWQFWKSDERLLKEQVEKTRQTYNGPKKGG